MASQETFAKDFPSDPSVYTYTEQLGGLCKFRYRYEPVNIQIIAQASKNTLNSSIMARV